jgi:hypothetical protein
MGQVNMLPKTNEKLTPDAIESAKQEVAEELAKDPINFDFIMDRMIYLMPKRREFVTGTPKPSFLEVKKEWPALGTSKMVT